MEVVIRDADLEERREAGALVRLIDGYARGPGGMSAPLGEEARRRLVPGLRAHPLAFVLLAFAGGQAGEPVGAAVCVEGFSTFAGRPLVNVHDLVVDAAHRGRGIGTALLAEVERRARARGACRITLEVNAANEAAQRLYRRLGFGPWEEPTLFVSRPVADRG